MYDKNIKLDKAGIMSDHTKYALADALKKVLKRKTLDKITISDLTNECGVNRQTFYYHFHDIYDLIEWMYTTSVSEAIGSNRKSNNWEEGMEGMCRQMLDNSQFILKTYHSRSGGHLKNIIQDSAYTLLMDVVNDASKGIHISESDKKFIADFYKYGFAGIVLSWIDKGMSEDPKIMVMRTSYLMKGNIQEAVRRLSHMEEMQELDHIS